MQGPGHPLEDLQPLHDGNVDMTDQSSAEFVTIGSHKMRFRGLNVRNPQPNMVYKWINNTEGEVSQAIQEGRKLVGPEDPEMSAVVDLLGLEASALDESCMFAGMRLVKTPIEVERRHQEERQRQHDASFKSGVSERGYFANTTTTEQHLGQAHGGTLRLMRDDHRTDVVEGSDPDGRRLDS